MYGKPSGVFVYMHVCVCVCVCVPACMCACMCELTLLTTIVRILQDLVNGYLCQCTEQWGGDNCSVNYYKCYDDTCKNGATCEVSE